MYRFSFSQESQIPVQILTTKLFVPPLRSRLVARPRLIQKLNQGLECGFVLISAPAGYGKSTLLSAWFSYLDTPAVWYSIDDSDNDPIRFLTYLGTTLSKIHPTLGEALDIAIQTSPLPAVEVLLTPLVNSLAQVQRPLWLVFDDFHLIQNPILHQMIRFLIDQRPAPLHLAIATRADPPLSLSRLRARSKMVELRQDDLRFTFQESADFFNETMGLRISSEDAARITERTEGWVAGLQIAALSMQNSNDVSGFINSFTGSHHHILDYLLEEVFGRQPEAIQAFLLKTSILNHLNGPLCDAVTGQTGGQSALEYLDRENLFVVPLDDLRCWYRYHHLLSDLLRKRLQTSQPALVPTLHLRASEWYEENGIASEAINHAFSAGEFYRAACLIEKTADTTFMHGELKTFLSWFERLPEEIACQLPLLCVYHAEALLLSGLPLDRVTKRLEGTPEYEAIQALVASYQGDIELSKKLSERVLEHLPKESFFLRGVISSSFGAILLLSGEIEPAIRAFLLAAEIGRENNKLMLEVIALCRLGQLHHLKAELRKAEGFIRKALTLSTDNHGSYLPVASMPLMSLAHLVLEWNDLNSASSFIRKAVDLCQESGGFWSVDCYLVYAFVLQAQGDSDGALEAVRNARKIAFRTEANRFDDIYTSAYEAQIFVAQQNLKAADQWARQGSPIRVEDSGNVVEEHRLKTHIYHLIEIEQTTLAKFNLAQGKPEEALNILLPLLPESEKRGRRMSVITNLVLQAMAFQAQGKLTEALNVLRPALLMAEPESLIRVFLDEGQPMERLLKIAAGHKIALEYVTKLLDVFRSNKPASPSISSHQKLIEEVSSRELDVLKLLAQGCSDKKIAEILVVSRETVHTHLGNIYNKLGVHSRTEAIARARELDLL